MNLTQNKQLIILLVCCFFSFFVNNGALEESLMEARNFSTAREILENGNWMVPTMNGEPRLAKPPMPTWATAVFASWFGIDAIWALRIPAGLVSVLMVFFFYFFVKKLTTNSALAFSSSLVLLTSMLLMQMARVGSWDVFCHALMLPAIALLYEGWHNNERFKNRFLWAGFFMSLSFMGKGPVSFFALLVPFFIAYIVAFGGRLIMQRWKWLVISVVITIVLSSIWTLYIYFYHQDEALKMVATESNSWANRHVKPFWFYAHFPVFTGVWSVFAFASLIYPFAVKKTVLTSKQYKFSFWWTISTFVLLSVIPEKKERYLLPVVIPMAMLIGGMLMYYFQQLKNEVQLKKIDAFIIKFHSLLMVLALIFLPSFYYFYGIKTGNFSVVLMLIYSLIAINFIYFLIKEFKNPTVFRLIYITSIVSMLGILFLPKQMEQTLVLKNPSYESFKKIRTLEKLKGLPLYQSPPINMNMVWDAGQVIHPLEVEKNAVAALNLPFAFISSTKPNEFSLFNQFSLSATLVDSIANDRKKEHIKTYIYLVGKQLY